VGAYRQPSHIRRWNLSEGRGRGSGASEHRKTCARQGENKKANRGQDYGCGSPSKCDFREVQLACSAHRAGRPA